MEPEGSLPHSQVAASSIQSKLPHPTSWISILILSSHLRLGLQSGLVPSGFPTKSLYMPLLSPTSAKCPAHLILLDFVTQKLLGEQYRSLSSSLRIFSTPLLLCSSWAQIFSSAPYSQTPSACVPPSMWATNFHTHTKQGAKLWFCVS